MRLILLLILFPVVAGAQSDSLSRTDSTKSKTTSTSIGPNQKKFVDSIFFSLSCFKGVDDGIQVLYKDGKIFCKGRFENWKLMCGLLYVYDSEGMLIAVKVYEEGVMTREISISNGW